MANTAACYQWAALHYGVIKRSVAISFISEDLTERLVRDGIWVRRYPGVYIISASREPWRQELMAIQLWLGQGCVVAGISAGRLHELEPCRGEDRLEFIIDRAHRSPEGVILRRCSLRPNDIVEIDGFRVTDVHRTLLDLGGCLPLDELEAAVEDAFRRRRSSVGHMKLRLKTYGGKGVRGCKPLRAIVEGWDNKPVSQSLLALRIEQALRGKGIPEPVREFTIRNDSGAFVARVDLAWPPDRVLIEAQSRRYHEQDPDMNKDMTRFNRLIDLGWRPFQITHRHWRNERAELVAQIRRAIAGR